MSTQKVVHNRLVFIDIARSIAILMMLEGHFIVMALSNGYRGDHYFIYEMWRFTRGLTAPLFFTVSGLVFTYLLVRKEQPFFKNIRVKKGLTRGVQLILWGYALQLNLFYLIQGNFSGFFYIFHVLQCIGASLILVILLTGFQRLIKGIPLTWWLAILGSLGFILKPTIYALDFSSVHPMIENIFVVATDDRAFKSIFALFPWFGFVALGGALGAYVSKNPGKVYTHRFIITLLLIGLVLNLFSDYLLAVIEPVLLLLQIKSFVGLGYLFARFGQVVWILALIILIGKHKRYLSVFYHRRCAVLKSWWIPVLLGGSGIGIILTHFFIQQEVILFPTFNLFSLGNLFLFVAVVITIAKLVKWNYNFFIKIGQNTLSIYIVHVMILYAGLFGFGMNTMINRALNPWYAIASAIGFMVFFTYFVKHIDVLRFYYQRLFFWKKWTSRKK